LDVFGKVGNLVFLFLYILSDDVSDKRLFVDFGEEIVLDGLALVA
jgi:hypothetical protein